MYIVESHRRLIGCWADPQKSGEDDSSFITLSTVATGAEGVSSLSPAIICNNGFLLEAGRGSWCPLFKQTEYIEGAVCRIVVARF